jgi:hypothetical protein
MSDSIVRIGDSAAVSRDGTGSARKKRDGRRAHPDEEHDTVTISAEARKRSAAEHGQD